MCIVWERVFLEMCLEDSRWLVAPAGRYEWPQKGSWWWGQADVPEGGRGRRRREEEGGGRREGGVGLPCV